MQNMNEINEKGSHSSKMCPLLVWQIPSHLG